MRSRIIVMVAALLVVAFPSGGWAQDGPADAARRFGNEQAAPSVPFPPGWKQCPRCQNNADRAKDNVTYKVEGHQYNPRDLTGTWGWDGVSNAFRDGKSAPPFTPEGKKLFDATIGDKSVDGKPLH